jgi:hypothetical protein
MHGKGRSSQGLGGGGGGGQSPDAPEKFHNWKQMESDVFAHRQRASPHKNLLAAKLCFLSNVLSLTLTGGARSCITSFSKQTPEVPCDETTS